MALGVFGSRLGAQGLPGRKLGALGFSGCQLGSPGPPGCYLWTPSSSLVVLLITVNAQLLKKTATKYRYAMLS